MAQPVRVHFVGIGGIGMSALARLLLEEGCPVSGSDLQQSSITAQLTQKGAHIFLGHHTDHVNDAGLVVVTAAARPDNPEVRQARAMGLPVIKRAELLGELMRQKRGIAVAGTHGKTTTASLIGCVLIEAGLDPTVLVGGEVPELGGNARKGSGPLLVAEADEFDASFLSLRPWAAVVTNVEAEHLDYYKSFGNVVKAFGMFLLAVPPGGHILFSLDDPVLARLQSSDTTRCPKLNTKPSAGEEVLMTSALQTRSLISYGFHPGARWRADQLRPNAVGGTDFLALLDGTPFGAFSLRIPGRHNVSNALAALATCYIFGVEVGPLRAALSSFSGVKRRFQVLGQAQGVTVVDDYAHHPTEIRATLAAARARYGKRRIRCVFQPHTYSRTKLLLPLFADAFQQADAVCVTEVYAAREENTWDIGGVDLARTIRHPDVAFTATLEEAAACQLGELRPDDVLVVMGAGDVYRVAALVLKALEAA